MGEKDIHFRFQIERAFYYVVMSFIFAGIVLGVTMIFDVSYMAYTGEDRLPSYVILKTALEDPDKDSDIVLSTEPVPMEQLDQSIDEIEEVFQFKSEETSAEEPEESRENP